MAALPCTVVTLLDAAKGLMTLTDKELLAAEVLLREQLDAKADGRTPRTAAQMLDEATRAAWVTLSQHQRDAIEVRQLCQTAVDNAARTLCDPATLRAEITLYEPMGPLQLRAILSFIKCAAR